MLTFVAAALIVIALCGGALGYAYHGYRNP
jgi:hypothetical protein